MTPEDLARLHRAAFAPERGWNAAEFETLCASPGVQLYLRPGGFALVRTVADEAELLTLAVDPAERRKGVADALMRDWLDATPARQAFLEVAEDNAAAQALYAKHGFSVSARRKAYYTRLEAAAVDALLMQAT
jgi:ribosomal-protein-alanine N-acetyltransferase